MCIFFVGKFTVFHPYPHFPLFFEKSSLHFIPLFSPSKKRKSSFILKRLHSINISGKQISMYPTPSPHSLPLKRTGHVLAS